MATKAKSKPAKAVSSEVSHAVILLQATPFADGHHVSHAILGEGAAREAAQKLIDLAIRVAPLPNGAAKSPAATAPKRPRKGE